MKRRLLGLGLAIALWAPVFLLASGLARGTNSTDFSGYDMGAKATAAQFTLDSPSLGVPAKPTGELNFAYSEATLQSGPSAYGLGSIAWPGQVGAALPTFLQGEIKRQCSCNPFPVDLPNYPIRAESFYPQGPFSASQNVGSTTMHSTARETLAEGSSYANKLGFPGVGNVGTETSMASSGFDPQGAVSIAEAAADGVTLLGNLITIDSVVTRTTARSDGVMGTVAGATTVTGARVGPYDVKIDSTGVKVAGQGASSAAAQQAVNQILNQAGVSIEVAPPIDTITGAKASRSLAGVIVTMKASTIAPLIALLPAAIQKQISDQVTFDQVITVQFAPAVVTAGAARLIEFVPPQVPAVGGINTDNGGSVPAAEIPVGDTGGSVVPQGSVPSISGGTPIAIAPARVTYKGVPVWLVVVLVLLALASSRPLTMFADRIFAARGSGPTCPEERG